MRISMLWAVVSLAAQSMLERLSIDASQAGAVSEMVPRFDERGEWCSRLETSGSRVCNLILAPADSPVPLVAHLEEDVMQFWVMQDDHQVFQSSATRVWDLVVQGSSKTPSLAMALSSTADMIEGPLGGGGNWR
jgi:hypothetical protein